MVVRQNDDDAVSTGESNLSCQQEQDNVPLSSAREEADSDGSLEWEDYFGSSVDLASTLLDMYDSLLARTKSKENGINNTSSTAPSSISVNKEQQSSPAHLYSTAPSGMEISNRFISSVPERTFQDKKRPLSSSSVSSCSSSSSSSLPRNGMDVKKSYLASIESLEDDLSEDAGIGRDSPARTTSLSSATVGGEGDRAANMMSRENHSTSESVPGDSMNSLPYTRAKYMYGDPSLTHIERVVLEIVETERSYVRDLNEIIEGYMKPISKVGKIDEQHQNDLFSNIEDIYRFNSSFLQELEQHGLDSIAIARCFVQHSTGFSIYTHYCTSYPRTVSALTDLMRNVETAKIFKERQMYLHHSLPLGSYLLKPVQRILKYHLLLQNIVKNLDKDKSEYVDIKNALSVMTGIAYHINDMKRKHEHAVRVQEIQSLLYGWEGKDLTTYGELVAEGTFRMLGAKAFRHLFLFDKMLLICKKKEEGILSYKSHIMCSNLMLIESIQGEPFCFHVIPFDNPRQQYTFQTRNMEQKREWCLQLKNVILENYNAVIPLHARQLVLQLGQNKSEESVPAEKSSSRKHLSAPPEYLERRKQERRRSEGGLNKAFRLKRGSKKGEAGTKEKNFPLYKERKSSYPSSNHSSPKKGLYSNHNACNGNDSETCSGKEKDSTTCKKLDPSCSSDKSDAEASTPKQNSDKYRKPLWRWQNVPEETTDTEAEEVEIKRILQYRPQHHYKHKPPGSSANPADEYVTFIYANSHAIRDRELSDSAYATSSPVHFEASDERSTSRNGDIRHYQSSIANRVRRFSSPFGSSTPSLSETDRKSSNYDNLLNLWGKLGTGNSKNGEDFQFSWRNSAALRRVQSFTGIARSKVQSLHQSLSFRQPSIPNLSDNSTEVENAVQRPQTLDFATSPKLDFENSPKLDFTNSPKLPTSNANDVSPTAPAVWLEQQYEHFSTSSNKCGSLPRSFPFNNQNNSSSSFPNHSEGSEANGSLISNNENQRPRMRLVDGNRIQCPEQRPFTIASDNLTNTELMNNFEHYMENNFTNSNAYHSPMEMYEEQTTSFTNTPTISMENISIHPEHKIYHQVAAKYASLKNAIASVGSKLVGLRASLSSPGTTDQTDSSSSISADGDYSSPPYYTQAKIGSKTDRDSGITTKFVQSISKAYSSVIRQRLRRDDSNKNLSNIPSPLLNRDIMSVNKPGSKVIGARMAKKWEEEYCYIPAHNYLYKKADGTNVRPDSFMSDTSHTSSSDGDKYMMQHMNERQCIYEHSNHFVDDQDDTPSDASDGSGDSCYERTFEAIENSCTSDMFRDSAIYSDPEDVDLSGLDIAGIHQYDKCNSSLGFYEHPNRYVSMHSRVKDLKPPLELFCTKRVKGAIIEKLKILEENSKFRKDDLSFPNLEGLKSIRQRQMELENLCNPRYGGSRKNSLVTEPYAQTSCDNNYSLYTKGTMDYMHNSYENTVNSPTKSKGWVKQVIDKFQADGGT